MKKTVFHQYLICVAWRARRDWRQCRNYESSTGVWLEGFNRGIYVARLFALRSYRELG